MTQSKKGRLLAALSRILVSAALALTVLTCQRCIPAVSGAVDQALQRLTESSAWAAFSQLRESLGQGDTVRQVFAGLGTVFPGNAA